MIELDTNEFSLKANRESHSDGREYSYDISLSGLKDVFDIISVFAQSAPGDFGGFELVPNDCNGILRIRIAGIFSSDFRKYCDGLKENCKNVISISITPVGEDMLFEFELSNLFVKSDLV